jgi:tRNA(Met) C34 N-acetyltransferase TmcA
VAVRVHEAVAEVKHGADLTAGRGRAKSAKVGYSMDDVELRVATEAAFLSPTCVGNTKQR